MNHENTPAHDMPIVVLNDDGEIQSRTTYSEWAIDNKDAITMEELQAIPEMIRAHGRAVLPMGAGGTFILRDGRETNYQAAVAVFVDNFGGHVPKSELSSPEEWESFCEFCAECHGNREAPKHAAELWILAYANETKGNEGTST